MLWFLPKYLNVEVYVFSFIMEDEKEKGLRAVFHN